MTKATRTIEWTSQSGSQIIATIEVARGYVERTERINADGDVVEVTKRDVVESSTISMAVNGKSFGVGTEATEYYQRSWVKAPESIKAAALVLQCKDTVIGIAKDNAERIQAAVAEATAEAEADPEWTAILAHRAEMADLERHQRNVESMMTLNGHTY